MIEKRNAADRVSKTNEYGTTTIDKKSTNMERKPSGNDVECVSGFTF
jgi:hypothetical protein